MVTEMKNAFDELISRLDTAEERLPKLEDVSVESMRAKKQTEQSLKKSKTEHSRTVGQPIGCNTGMMETPDIEERREQKEHLKQ